VKPRLWGKGSGGGDVCAKGDPKLGGKERISPATWKMLYLGFGIFPERLGKGGELDEKKKRKTKGPLAKDSHPGHSGTLVERGV